MRTTTPYLHFKGNAEEAVTFYKSLFGGEFTGFQRYKEVPGGEKMPARDQERLIHVSLQINSSISIMASDAMASAEDDLLPGNNYHICLHTESESETQRIFDGLSKDGRIEMPLNKTFWGAYFGMCADRFGIRWMVHYMPASA